MSELEILKQIHNLQTEEILLLKKALLARNEQVQHLNDLVENQDKIIELQKSILNEFIPQTQVPHLRLVKNENE
jgi:hypothetical protein